MKALGALFFLTVVLAWTSAAQTCLAVKPVELPPLGHANAKQTCVCESMNRGCHWAWVDLPTSTAQQTTSPPPYVNLADQARRDREAAERRAKELAKEREFQAQQQRESDERQGEAEARKDAHAEAQTKQATDLEILKAIHDGVLAPVAPGDNSKLPTIKNSTGQEFRVVAPVTEHPTPPAPPTDSTQYFTQGLLNGRMWAAMSEVERTVYVSTYLQGYMAACFSATSDPAQQQACYAKLGNIAHTNPLDPHEIVEGVDNIFAIADNRSLIIPLAIKAASMKANGEPQERIDGFLQIERNAVAAPSK